MRVIISKRHFLGLAVLVVLLCPRTAAAQEEVHLDAFVDKMKRWGIIIGINGYDDANINGLRYAAQDAQAVYNVLTHPATGSFRKEHVHLLTSGGEGQPTRSNILESLAVLRKTAGPEDTVLFYFSGHGLTQQGENYLLPIDARTSIPGETAIPLSRVYQAIRDTKRQIILLDACHSGWHRSKGVMSGRMSASFADVVFAEAEGRVTFTSCNIDESSFEDDSLESGVFTYYLLEALRGEADASGNQAVTALEANLYLGEKVRAWAFKNRRPQTPRLSGNILGEIVLTQGLPAHAGLPPSEPVDYTSVYPPSPPSPKPRIMVIIPEYHRRSTVIFPAGETEIIRLLVQHDFPVVDQRQIQDIRYKDEAKRAAQGDVAAAVALGNQFESEIIIVGEAQSSRLRGRLPGNMVSCSAQMVVKVIQTDTGKILATHNLTGKGLDLSEELAAQKAVVAVSEKMADYLIEELEYKWHEGAAGQPQPLTLKITNVTFKELLSFEDALRKRIPSVQHVHRHYFDVAGKVAESEIVLIGDVYQFVTALGAIGFEGFEIEVLNQTPQVLDIRIHQNRLTLRLGNVAFKELLLVEDALKQHIPSVKTVRREYFDAIEKIADVEVALSGDLQQFVNALGSITFDGFEVEVLSQNADGLDLQINQQLSLDLKVASVTFKELLRFENALEERIPVVRKVAREHFNADEKAAGIKITIAGDMGQFVEELALVAFDDFDVEVLNQTPQLLDVRIQQKLPITLMCVITNVSFKELLLFESAIQKRIPNMQEVERQYFDTREKIAEIKIAVTSDLQQFVKDLALITFDDFEVEVLNQSPQRLDIQINQK